MKDESEIVTEEEKVLSDACERIIDYIENDSECPIPIERFFDEEGNHITKKKYGLILLEILCQELRDKFVKKPDMVWTEELLKELQDDEDAVSAYENGYSDTHDLGAIADNLDDYREKIEKYKEFLSDKELGFSSYRVVDGGLVLKDILG